MTYKPSEKTCKLAAAADKAVGQHPASNSPTVNCDEFKKLDYSIELKSGGNRVLTPLEIPDFKELPSGNTKNKESIDFVVTRNKDKADDLLIEVFDGATLLFSDANTSGLLSGGDWQWDGYDTSGILDTRVLKSKNLKVRLTASNTQKQQVNEFKLSNKAKEVDWVDAKVDRNAQTVEVTVRPSFSDGGVEGTDTYNLTSVAVPYSSLMQLAKDGIELYWSRNGSRPKNIGTAVNTPKGAFQITVTADVNTTPHAEALTLIELLDQKPGRFQRSNTITNRIYHNLGFRYRESRSPASSSPDPDQLVLNKALPTADGGFKRTAAHEFGHFILAAYGGGGFWKGYSSTHKGSSTWASQEPIPGKHVPLTGEIDLMHYHENRHINAMPRDPVLADRLSRTVAAEQDVNSLLWLSRIRFND
jgi:hypothetical protein